MPNVVQKPAENIQKEPKSQVKTEKKAFYYRGIQVKEPFIFKGKHIVEEKDFKLGEYNEVKIVSTGKRDFHEFVNSDKNKNAVGLNNVLANALMNGVRPEKRPFDSTGEEGVDLTRVPETISELKDELEKTRGADKRLDGLATQIGLSRDELIDKSIKGTLNDYIDGFVKNLRKVEGNKQVAGNKDVEGGKKDE